VDAVHEAFGGWDHLARLCKGYYPEYFINIDKKYMKSFLSGLQNFSKEDCLEALKLASKLYQNDIYVSQYVGWQKRNPKYPYFTTIVAEFGSWSKAKEEIKSKE
jgi:hypothetical protein